MNARLYNPTLHRFLSPDTYIQDPYNTQNYNRYSYCVNNPTKYTDITGNIFGIDDAIIIAVAVAVLSYTATALLADVPFTIQGLVTNMAIAAFSAAVTFGIGEAASGFTNFWSRASFQALAHGTFQGGMTAVQGGKFWSGFAAGAVSSIVSSAMMGGDTTEHGFFKENNWSYGSRITHHQGLAAGMNKTVGTLATAAISGGAASYLTGGNFWQGAATGLIIAGLNHLGHDDDQQPKPKRHKVINNTKEAREHYYNGKGESVIIGEGSRNELRNSSAYRRVMNRLSSGTANNLNGSFDVDMTFDTFHIGNTNVDYTTTCTDGTCTTVFTEFVRDGYYDPDFLNEPAGYSNPIKRPDGLGPNLELGGTPYMYIPSTHVYIYKNPGYKF